MISISDVLLFLSGGLIVGSILLPQIGFINSALSVNAVAAYSGTGTSIGTCIFVFYTVGKGDFIGSVLTGIIAGVAVGATNLFFLRKQEMKKVSSALN